MPKLPLLLLVLWALISAVSSRSSSRCSKYLPLYALDARCSANSQMISFPCERALDGLDHTMWAPMLHETQHVKPFYQISLPRPVTITRVEFLQHSMGTGRANRISLTFDEGRPLHKRLAPQHNSYSYDQVWLPSPVVASTVTITIEGVDLLGFGGFKEVKLAGCASGNKIRKKLNNKSSTSRYRSGRRPTSSASDDDDSDSSWFNPAAAYGSFTGLALGGISILVLGIILAYITVAGWCRGGGQGGDEENGSSWQDDDESGSVGSDESIDDDEIREVES